ncbi:MAG: M2 family metallopeptidase [Planctomycetia bacterium]|nr:M2 family metallopeptidase [Planctomycetia bacterium]
MRQTRRNFIRRAGIGCGAVLIDPLTGMVPADAPDSPERGDSVPDIPEQIRKAKRSIQRHHQLIRPLEIEMNLQWWAANTAGTDESYARKAAAETAMSTAYANRDEFMRLKSLLSDGRFAELADSGDQELRHLYRQTVLLYQSHLSQQVDPVKIRECYDLSNQMERMFNTYRPVIDGVQVLESTCRRKLFTETDSHELRKAWEALKGACPTIEPLFIDLVKRRNESAVSIGFRDYHQMSLAVNEQNQDEIIALFDQLDQLTRKVYQREKADLDTILAGRYGISINELRPWHYMDPFFQEAPPVYDPDSDPESIYHGIDTESICRKFYSEMGIGIEDVLERSDLYERPGKNPNGFAMDVDRAGDVRVLCNLTGASQWLATLLHELGHAAYMSTHIPESLPYLLRTEAHALTTEGIALLFERTARECDSMLKMGLTIPDPGRFRRASTKLCRMRSLLFTRWTQVMLRFEKEAYADPDQDLCALWWDLVEEYQEVRRPEDRHHPDYLAKLHFYQAPCYYHNYQMGELFASQILQAMLQEILPEVKFGPASMNGGKSLVSLLIGNRDTGEWLQRHVFDFGRTGDYQALCRAATDKELSAEAFAMEFVEQVHS